MGSKDACFKVRKGEKCQRFHAMSFILRHFEPFSRMALVPCVPCHFVSHHWSSPRRITAPVALACALRCLKAKSLAKFLRLPTRWSKKRTEEARLKGLQRA